MTSTSGTKPMVVKSKRGGRRPGAGRPPGAKNKKPPAPKRAVGKKVFDKNSENGLPSQKIIDIIDRCKSTNVKSLKYGNLEIEFTGNSVPITEFNQTASTNPETAPKAVAADKELTEDTRLAQLMMDDPPAFEQEVIDSHLGWTADA